MFGRRQTTAMEYKPVPVNYTPVTRAADLIAGDLVTYNDGHRLSRPWLSLSPRIAARCFRRASTA